jgi:hypothetical protein
MRRLKDLMLGRLMGRTALDQAPLGVPAERSIYSLAAFPSGSRQGVWPPTAARRGYFGAKWNNAADSGMVTLPSHANPAPAR